MLRILYDFVLVLSTLFYLPKFLWDSIRHRKYRKSFLEKLGFKLPTFSLPHDTFRIWIHSVSVGETKAVAPLVEKLRNHASIVISTTTETGLEEAKRSMPELDHYFYLPLDFSWTMRALVSRIKPDLLILVETDFWYNLVSYNPKVALVNGKISETSLARFKLIPFFTRRLFEQFDLLCVQSGQYARRFESLGIDPSKIIVTGNLKFDQPFPHIDLAKWKKDLGITPQTQVITLGSTHETEEDNLLTALIPLFDRHPHLKILVVPRHPERFRSVAELVAKKKISYGIFSDHLPKTGSEKVILIDAMGILSACYQLSDLAIVGGSFVSHVGGHNIFEPAALGVPVLFGPHMESQKDLVDTVLQAGAGKQVTLDELPSIINSFLENPPQQMKEAGLKLAREVDGATERTFIALNPYIR